MSVADWARAHGLGTGRHPDPAFVDLGEHGIAIDGPDPMRLDLVIAPNGTAAILTERVSAADGTGTVAPGLRFTPDGLACDGDTPPGPTTLTLSPHLHDLAFVTALLRHRRNTLSAQATWRPVDHTRPLTSLSFPPDPRIAAELHTARRLLAVMRHPDRAVRAVALGMLHAGFTGPTDHLLTAAQSATT